MNGRFNRLFLLMVVFFGMPLSASFGGVSLEGLQSRQSYNFFRNPLVSLVMKYPKTTAAAVVTLILLARKDDIYYWYQNFDLAEKIYKTRTIKRLLQERQFQREEAPQIIDAVLKDYDNPSVKKPMAIQKNKNYFLIKPKSSSDVFPNFCSDSLYIYIEKHYQLLGHNKSSGSSAVIPIQDGFQDERAFIKGLLDDPGLRNCLVRTQESIFLPFVSDDVAQKADFQQHANFLQKPFDPGNLFDPSEKLEEQLVQKYNEAPFFGVGKLLYLIQQALKNKPVEYEQSFCVDA